MSATEPNISILTIFDPNISPKANAGFGGSSNTADMFAESSGRDVAKATSMLPTNSLPKPVIEAKISPYFAKYEPKITVAIALNAKIIIFRVNISMTFLPLTSFN